MVRSENNERGRAVFTVRGVDTVEPFLSKIISIGEGYVMIDMVCPDGRGTDVTLLDILFEGKDGLTDGTSWFGDIFERSPEDVLNIEE